MKKQFRDDPFYIFTVAEYVCDFVWACGSLIPSMARARLDLPQLEAVCERGSWFATVGGESLACVHKRRSDFKNRTYRDNDLRPSNPGHVLFFDKIVKAQKVVLADDELLPDGGFRRLTYIGVWAVSDVAFDEDNGLTFKFDDRLAHLK